MPAKICGSCCVFFIRTDSKEVAFVIEGDHRQKFSASLPIYVSNDF